MKTEHNGGGIGLAQVTLRKDICALKWEQEGCLPDNVGPSLEGEVRPPEEPGRSHLTILTLRNEVRRVDPRERALAQCAGDSKLGFGSTEEQPP